MSTIASANASASAPGATAARLRPARAVDAYALWIWANDPDMRHAAHDRAPIPWAEHLAWLARALHDPAHVVLLAESGTGQPLGAIRFESADGWQSARLSYVLAPEERGRSAADASGYVSQSRLLAAARVSFDEPLARLLPWTGTEWIFSPLGYRPGPAPGEVVPTYPPGLPLTMAAARAIGGEWAPFFVVPLLGGLAVFCTYLLGARLHSRRAGLTAALLLATSPIFLFQLVQPMSDVPAVAWVTHPELFGGRRLPVAIETAGQLTAGQTVVDWFGRWALEPNVEVLLDVDSAALARVFTETIVTAA